MNKEQLREIMPHLPEAKADEYLPHLDAAMSEANINSTLRCAAFIAQIAHESAELHYMEEIASGQAYEGRHDLGNTQPGDGHRFKGRGPLQLTGRANYKACGLALGVDLENHPELAATPEVAFRTSAWFWTTHKLNDLADKSMFIAVTKKINGGTNGLESRLAYYRKALQVLGINADLKVCE